MNDKERLYGKSRETNKGDGDVDGKREKRVILEGWGFPEKSDKILLLAKGPGHGRGGKKPAGGDRDGKIKDQAFLEKPMFWPKRLGASGLRPKRIGNSGGLPR